MLNAASIGASEIPARSPGTETRSCPEGVACRCSAMASTPSTSCTICSAGAENVLPHLGEHNAPGRALQHSVAVPTGDPSTHRDSAPHPVDLGSPSCSAAPPNLPSFTTRQRSLGRTGRGSSALEVIRLFQIWNNQIQISRVAQPRLHRHRLRACLTLMDHTDGHASCELFRRKALLDEALVWEGAVGSTPECLDEGPEMLPRYAAASFSFLSLTIGADWDRPEDPRCAIFAQQRRWFRGAEANDYIL